MGARRAREKRWAAAAACAHPFFTRRGAKKAKHGLGTIVDGFLYEEVLEYLQGCPQWRKWHEECKRTNFAPNKCLSAAEGKLRMKKEYAGYITIAILDQVFFLRHYVSWAVGQTALQQSCPANC